MFGHRRTENNRGSETKNREIARSQAQQRSPHNSGSRANIGSQRGVKKARDKSGLYEMVDRMRIELTTSALRTRRSPS